MNSRTAIISALICAMAVQTADSQSVRGAVRDAGGVPLAGVVVQLLDSASTVRGQGLSDELGRFFVATPRAGAYRVQARRIGFRPVTSEAFTLAAGQESPKDFELVGVPSGLDTVKVGGRNVCGRASQQAAATAVAWEQVRTAILATELSAARKLVTTTVTYKRRLDEFGWRILAQNAQVQSEIVAQPWLSVPPALLSQSGYIAVGTDSTSYRAPGLDMLASTNFIDDHCFRLETGRDRQTIGIAFEPIPERRTVGEIRGTMFVDRKTSELRGLEFRYVYRDQPDLADGARGSMEFVRLRNGAWTIAKWEIRMPVKEIRLTQGGGAVAYLGGVDTKVVTTGVRIEGGELAMARISFDTLFARPPLVLRGELRDSASGRAVSGADVTLDGTGQFTTSGTGGQFRIENVLPGEYMLEVRTPGLDSLGMPSQTPVSITDAKEPIAVRVLTAAQIVNRVCGSARVRTRIPGIVLGVAAGADQGPPPRGTKATLEWTDTASGSLRTIPVPLEADGSFTACGVPTGTAITLRAVADSVRAEPALLLIAPEKPLEAVRVVMDVRAAATASFAGIVSTDSGRATLEDAEIILPDAMLHARSDAKGAFRLIDVSPGTHRVVVRKPGYGPMETSVRFTAHETTERRIVLSRVTVLNEVVVTAMGRAMAEFEDNRKLGLGTFITREFLATQEARRLSEVMSGVPGIRVIHTRRGATTRPNGEMYIASSRVCHPMMQRTLEGSYIPNCVPCHAAVYVDGHLVTTGAVPFDINTLGVTGIEAIEYYKSAAGVPAKYVMRESTCGLVVIHTRQSR